MIALILDQVLETAVEAEDPVVTVMAEISRPAESVLSPVNHILRVITEVLHIFHSHKNHSLKNAAKIGIQLERMPSYLVRKGRVVHGKDKSKFILGGDPLQTEVAL